MNENLPPGMSPDLANASPHQQMLLRVVMLADGSFHYWGLGGIVTFDANQQPQFEAKSMKECTEMVLAWVQLRMNDMSAQVEPQENKIRLLRATGPVPRA